MTVTGLDAVPRILTFLEEAHNQTCDAVLQVRRENPSLSLRTIAMSNATPLCLVLASPRFPLLLDGPLLI